LTKSQRRAKQFRTTSAQILKTFPNNLHSLSTPHGARRILLIWPSLAVKRHRTRAGRFGFPHCTREHDILVAADIGDRIYQTERARSRTLIVQPL